MPKKPTRILNSFSMGRSSARQFELLKEMYPDAHIVTVCANTGQEHERSLEFGKAVDEAFGLRAVVVEAVVDPRPREGTRHKRVTWDTAYSGEAIFDAVIAKYGIPNVNFPHCTRELKDRPITSYLRSIGWEAGSYVTALGMRADEPKRLPKRLGGSKKTDNPSFIYPLAEAGVTLADVLDFWSAQSFDLGLTKARHGNCKACWKKSEKKLLLNMQEHPEWFDFTEHMESKYPDAGPGDEDRPRVFFRGAQSTKDLRRKLRVIGHIDERADASEPETGCAEACHPFADDAA